MRRSSKNCGCPSGAKKVSTKGRGRGFVCVGKRNGKTRFVKANCR